MHTCCQWQRGFFRAFKARDGRENGCKKKKGNACREGKGSAMADGCRCNVLDERGSWSCRENYHGQRGKAGEDKKSDGGRARGGDREEASVLHRSCIKK